MEFASGFIGTDGDFFAHNDFTFVDFLIEEKRGQARFGFAVDDGEVDGSSTSILGQERGMEVERP